MSKLPNPILTLSRSYPIYSKHLDKSTYASSIPTGLARFVIALHTSSCSSTHILLLAHIIHRSVADCYRAIKGSRSSACSILHISKHQYADAIAFLLLHQLITKRPNNLSKHYPVYELAPILKHIATHLSNPNIPSPYININLKFS